MEIGRHWKRLGKAFGVGLLACALGGVHRAQEGGAEKEAAGEPAKLQEVQPAVQGEKPADPRSAATRYRSLGDRDAVLAAWLAGGLAQELKLGESAGGRELFGVQFGGQGPVPLEERPMILLIGGLDGRSLAGCEAVLQVTDELMARPEELSGAVTYVVIPWANPDGLARWVTTGCGEGRNDRALDDDGDGAIDEDPADDLDGDGVLMEMLIEDPEGPWVRSEDGRFLRPAREGEAPRYLRSIEGRDDDGDGRFNEDQAGGVLLDRNFPMHWAGPWEGVASGPWPLSEPVPLALAQLVLGRRTAAVLLYQGNHGQLVMPGGRSAGPGIVELPLAADLPVYQSLVQSFAEHTGRVLGKPKTLAEAYGEERSGVAMDWFYAATGALAMEIGIWGPHVCDEPVSAAEASAAEAARLAGQTSAVEDGGLEASWARWLDKKRGGLGFADWHPVDLGDGREALIGGWERFTCVNPPSSLLPRVLKGQADFVLEIGRGLPRFEIELEEMRRNGRIVIVRARVRNQGVLPTGVGPVGAGGGTRLKLQLPEGVKMVAGDLENDLGHLPAQGSSPSFEWLLVAPEGALVHLEVDSAWSAPQSLEVRLDR